MTLRNLLLGAALAAATFVPSLADTVGLSPFAGADAAVTRTVLYLAEHHPAQFDAALDAFLAD